MRLSPAFVSTNLTSSKYIPNADRYAKVLSRHVVVYMETGPSSPQTSASKPQVGKKPTQRRYDYETALVAPVVSEHAYQALKR